MSSPADELDAMTKQAAPPPMGDQYMAHVQAREGAAAADELDAMVGGGKPKQQPPAPLAEMSAGPDLKKAGSVAGAVASDVGSAMLEQPRAIYKGVRDAYQGVVDLAKDAGDFTNKFLPALQVTDKGGKMLPLSDMHWVSAQERAQNPDLPGSWADDIHFPDVDEPKSKIAGLEKNVIQFVTGMSVAGGQLKALGLPTEAAGMAGRSLSAVKGFMSMFEAFDGPKQNLSNLVQSVPALKNPVTEMLSIQGDDSDVVKRLKTAAEGTMGAQAIDGLVGGLRFLRGVTKAQDGVAAAAEHPGEDLGEDIGPPRSNGLSALGNPMSGPDEPLVSAKFNQAESKLAAQAGKASAMTPEQVGAMHEGAEQAPAAAGTGTQINFARIDGPDDIKRAMQELVNHNADDLETARRGVKTFADTQLGADATDAWKTVMSRRVGEALNDEQSLAARQLWTSSAAKLKEVMDIATGPGGATPENLFAFRKMLTTHMAIEQEVMGARAEAGRALGSWRIPAGEAPFRMGDVTRMLQQDTAGGGSTRGGLDVAWDMAQRTKALFDSGDLEHLSYFGEKSLYAKTRDAALEAWTNGLLTSPLTHVKVIASNAATIALRIGERRAAAAYSSVLGDTDGVALGEASAQYAGLVGGIKDSLRFAGRAANAFLNEKPLPALENDPLSNAVKAAKTGVYSAGEDMPEVSQAGRSFPGAISSQALGIAQSGWLGRGVDLLGQVIRSPGRALTAEHDFFRSIAYRMELNALAVRQATQEMGAGSLDEKAFAGRVSDIVANPPPSITIGSMDAMKYQTFTDAPGKLAQHIESLRNDFPMTRVILPFYKIPSRILSYTFERTPIAPLMASYQANIAAGGAREALARSQLGLGTSVLLAAADAAMSGQITGSGPPSGATRNAMMNTGWLPYSANVNGRWFQYNHLETVGSSMAMAADIASTLHAYHEQVNGDMGPDAAGQLAAAAALSVAQNVTSKTYLSGLSRFFDALANPRTSGKQDIQSMLGSIVPAGVAAADRMTDPYQRAIYSMMDAIKARTPGISEGMAPRQNTWGEPISNTSDMGKAYDLLSPFATRTPTDSPIDKEIVRLGANVNRPSSKVDFGGGALIDLAQDPKMYARYSELAGHAYKDPSFGGQGAKDALNDLVSGSSPYSPMYDKLTDGPQGSKAEMIQGIMNQYREGAKMQLLDEYPKLQPLIQAKRQAYQVAKAPQQ